MNLASLPVIREWCASWRLLARQKLLVIASGFMDLLFLIAFGFMTTPVYGKLTEHVIIIGALVSQQLRAAAGRMRPAIIDTLFQEPVRGYTWQFLGLLVVLAVVVFVLFWIFQGLAWWLATAVAGKNMRWRAFLTRFARVNVVWFGLFVLWYVLDTVFDLRRIAVEKATGQAATGAGIVLFGVLVLIWYFAIISYPLLRIKQSFVLGTQKAGVLVPAFALVIVHFLAGNLVVRWLAGLSTALMFVVGAILLVVLLAWARVYMSRMVWSAEHGLRTRA